MSDRNRPPVSLGIRPEILQKFQEINPEHGDLKEYLQAIATANLRSRLDLEQANLDEAILASLLDRQSVPVASWTTTDPAVEQNSLYWGNNSLDPELDAAIASSLEDPIAETSTIMADSQGATSLEPPALEAAQGDIDPDNMTYEQRRSLEESVGFESRGISKELLDSFPTQKLKRKSGWFSSRKSEPERCSICLTEYEIGSELLTLPCLHLYHTSCIAEWLKDNKTCPVCTTDISEPQS